MSRVKSVPTDKTRAYSTSQDFNITVLISGSGTNLQALIDACGQAPATKDRPAPRQTLPHGKITHVISNRREAKGLERAQNAHVPVTYHNLLAYKKRYPDTEAGNNAARANYDTDLAQKILTHVPCPDLVVCAGFMHILSREFVNQLAKANVPIINLHPALPGKFTGSDAIGRAFKAYQRGEISRTGVMVHYVIEEVDMGKPIAVKEIDITETDTQDSLEEKIHQVEWKLIVEATGKVLADLEENRRQEG